MGYNYDEDEIPDQATQRINQPQRQPEQLPPPAQANDFASVEHPTRRLVPPGRQPGPPPANTRRLQGPERLPPLAHPEGVGFAVTMICSECGGEMMWARASGYGRMQLSVEQWDPPEFFRVYRQTLLNALVCRTCGFTKLYAQEPRKLIE